MGLLNFLKPKVHPVELSVETFGPSVANSPVPVIVDFYSTTCVPCQQQARTMTKFASDFRDDVRVGMFNVEQDTNATILAKYGVRAVPTVIVFFRGEAVEQFAGITGYLKLKEVVEKIDR